MSDDGYVYVASMSQAFYRAAVDSAISLRDHYPEANITLFTHKSFVRDNDLKFFSNVVTSIPVHIRAKMWGIARSPYHRTLYLDCDTEIRSDRIKDVFDILQDNDIMFTRIVPHVSADKYIDQNNNLEYHGGIVLYNNDHLTMELMDSWYHLYSEQINAVWSNSKFKNYSARMQGWDQFTMWYLLNVDPKFKDIKHDFFPNGGHEYNYIYLLEEDWESNKPYKHLDQVIYHYTIPKDRVNAGYIKNPPGSIEDFD